MSSLAWTLRIPLTQPQFPKGHELCEVDTNIHVSFLEAPELFSSSRFLEALKVSLQDEHSGEVVCQVS